MSNIRQRRGPSPSRDSFGNSSTSWEIANDDSGDNAHVHAHAHAHNDVIPMYNPTNVSKSKTSPSSAPSSVTSKMSHRVSWNTIMDAKNANTDFLREDSMANTYHHSPSGLYNTAATAGKVAGGGGYHNNALRSGQRSLPSMSPALLPDSAYRAYLSGRQAEQQKKSGMDKIQMANFCGCFSLVGFFFLTFIGILIDTQPMYLQGILPKHEQYSSGGKKMQTFYATDISDRLEPASHAYRGALLYLLTALVCLGYAYNMHWFLFKKGWQQYRDIDDVDSTVPAFHHSNSSGGLGGANDNDFLPINGAIHRKAYGDHNGLIVRTWQSASVKFQRLWIYLSSIWQDRRRNRRRFAGAKDV